MTQVTCCSVQLLVSKLTRKGRWLLCAAVAMHILEFASEQLQADREVVLAAVSMDGVALQFASNEMRGDHEVVFKAVSTNGLALRYASEELRRDPDVVVASVQCDCTALQFAADELQSNRDVVLAAVKSHDGRDGTLASSNTCGPLDWMAAELSADTEIIMAAVNDNGCFLHYASQELRSNRDIVLAAIENDGRALESAADHVRSDPDLVLAAVRNNIRALDFVARDLFDCETDTSIDVVKGVLRVIHEIDIVTGRSVPWFLFYNFEQKLIDLRLKLQVTDRDFSKSATVMPDFWARRWVLDLRKTQWCLHQACKNASVPKDVQRTVEQFTTLTRDSQTASLFLKYSDIILLWSKIFWLNGERGGSWWEVLCRKRLEKRSYW